MRYSLQQHPVLFLLACIAASRQSCSSALLTTCPKYRTISSTSPRSVSPLFFGRQRRISSAEKRLVSQEEAARAIRSSQAKRRLEKAVRQEERIYILENQKDLSEAERAELEGLRRVRENFEEQYESQSFSGEHLEFKRLHNEAFVALARYCQQTAVDDEPINIFFLDGPNGGTALALIDGGNFEPSQCFVANRHDSTCQALRVSGGGPLPDENVIHATAAESLGGGALSHVEFAAYYFDGCGGFVPHIVGMLTAALLRDDKPTTTPIAVGFSILGGTKDLVEKDLQVCRALAILAKRRGMRTRHVMDDPTRYGIPKDIPKVGGSGGGGTTFTTWLLLESDDGSY